MDETIDSQDFQKGDCNQQTGVADVIQRTTTDVAEEMETVEDMEEKERWEKIEFQSVEEVHDFYYSYAHRKGFSVRKDYHKNGKVNGEKTKEIYYIRLLCNKEGLRKQSDDPKQKNGRPYKRLEERTDCEAMIIIHYSPNRSVYCIKEWNVHHNHPLIPSQFTYMLRSNRKMNPFQEQIAKMHNEVGIKNRFSYEAMAMAVGGVENLGFLPIDLKNHLGTQRQRTMKLGEATALQKYFRSEAYKNPSFFYEIEVDSDEQISNIFWADNKMRMDYKVFGDVITFDTTYRTNKDYRPLALFVGFNHHRMICVFGAALMYDETAESFQWLFRTFLDCMDNKAPMTIFTDQANAISKALGLELKGTYHALCTWHILENAKKRLSQLFTNEVSQAFRHLIYNVDDEEEFEFYWNKMIEDYFPPGGHIWLKYIYDYRTQWSSAWVKKHFTAGLVTTQLVESCNSNVRGYLQSDYNLIEFFTHFKSFVNGRRHAEREADFDAMNKLPNNRHSTSSLVTSAEVYTHRMFQKFQHEYEESLRYQIEQVLNEDPLSGGVSKYAVFKRENNSNRMDSRLVLIQKTKMQLECSCRLYETLGILCKHILKVMTTLSSFIDCDDFKILPEKYVMKRWTIKAKEGMEITMEKPKPENTFSQNYQYLTRKLNHLAALVSMDPEAVKIVDGNVNIMINQFSRCTIRGTPTPQANQDDSVELALKAWGKCIKKRENPNKSRKRLKSSNEVGRQKAMAKHQKVKQKKQIIDTDASNQKTIQDKNGMDIDLNRPLNYF